MQYIELVINHYGILFAFLSIFFVIKWQSAAREAESLKQQLFPKKEKLYSDFIDFMFTFLAGAKELGENKDKDLTEKGIIEELQRFNKNILLVASNKVIAAYSNFMRLTRKQEEPVRMIEEFYNLVIAMRKEFGHRSLTMPWKTIARISLTDIDEYDKKPGEETKKSNRPKNH